MVGDAPSGRCALALLDFNLTSPSPAHPPQQRKHTRAHSEHQGPGGLWQLADLAGEVRRRVGVDGPVVAGEGFVERVDAVGRKFAG